MTQKNILFTSWHFYLDPSNGASITARELLLALAKRGWDVSTFCGPALDFVEATDPLGILRDHNIRTGTTLSNHGVVPFSLAQFKDNGLRSSIFIPGEKSPIPSPEVGAAFLQLLEKTIRAQKPKLIATYGGYWLGRPMLELAHSLKIKTVVLLMNCVYRDPAYFQCADLTLVLSEWSSKYYSDKIGISTTPLPPIIDWGRVLNNEPDATKKYVTFINPDPDKGVYWFAGIVRQIHRLRPEIPFLVVSNGFGSTIKRL